MTGDDHLGFPGALRILRNNPVGALTQLGRLVHAARRFVLMRSTDQ